MRRVEGLGVGFWRRWRRGCLSGGEQRCLVSAFCADSGVGTCRAASRGAWCRLSEYKKSSLFLGGFFFAKLSFSQKENGGGSNVAALFRSSEIKTPPFFWEVFSLPSFLFSKKKAEAAATSPPHFALLLVTFLLTWRRKVTQWRRCLAS